MIETAPDTDIAHFDIVVIGGGINGAGIARDAAGRGYSVCLCEAGDVGGGTSSASTKLIHGGLRYLEHYEFLLVRKALKEREVLWKIAPHIIRPMRFVLPHHEGLRPAWLLRLGLFLYDHIGGRKLLPATRTIDLRRHETGGPLKPAYRKAFEYSDCWVEDSRLVVLNLRDAQARGADIRPRTAVTGASFSDGLWRLALAGPSGEGEEISARVVINAAGPWVDQVLRTVFGHNDAHNVRLVRGSHIVIPRKFEHDRSYIFQNSDDRIIFAIPYEDDYTLIGTTDAEHGEEMVRPEISQAEIRYLCEMASAYFRQPVTADDVVWTYSGVRPLFDDGASKAQEATRDYVIRADEHVGGGSLINIFGGKITTYRKLAEAILDDVGELIGARGESWTGGSALPGGDFAIAAAGDLRNRLAGRYPFIADDLLRRLIRHYGTDVTEVLGAAASVDELGRDFGAGLYECEVRYLMQREWAVAAEDVVFRRTRLGIGMSDEQISALASWMAQARDEAVRR